MTSVLVTGAGGYIGTQVVAALAADPREVSTIVAADVRDAAPEVRVPGVVYATVDVRDPALTGILAEHAVDVVVHLAAIVTPGRSADRELERSVDVGGTRNVLDACIGAGIRKLIVTSSGAAYGYHADSPAAFDENDPLRGNPEFAYSDHKRLVEEMLAAARREHPELAQLVFRPGTVLGATTRNQITDLFDKPVVLGLRGSSSPWVFVWDSDVVACILEGIHSDKAGIYNLAGDGSVTQREIARMTGKPYVAVPVPLMRAALRLLRSLRLTQYGPEQVDFLRYRPVLSNRRLKEQFGYTPRRTSRETFEAFIRDRRSVRGTGPER